MIFQLENVQWKLNNIFENERNQLFSEQMFKLVMYDRCVPVLSQD